MKYLKQLCIILTVSFIGEFLNFIVPLPIPASIYGIVILFVCLCTGIFKLASIKETGKFLVDIMPIMFVPPSIALMDAWAVLAPIWFAFIFTAATTTFIVMGVGGWSAQLVIRIKRRKEYLHTQSNALHISHTASGNASSETCISTSCIIPEGGDE